MRDSIAFLFGDEWGEIETSLPLIHSVKARTKFKIICIILKSSTYYKGNKYKDLKKLLHNNCDLILYPDVFTKWEIFCGIFKQKKELKSLLVSLYQFFSYIFLKKNFDINNSLYFKKIKKHGYNLKYFCNPIATVIDSFWFKSNKDLKFLLIPSAPTLRGGNVHSLRNVNVQAYDQARMKKYSFYKNYPKDTILFASDNNEKIYFEKYCSKNINILPLGYTRLEDEWIKIIKSNVNLNEKLKKKQILILLGKEWYIGINELKNKISNIFKIAQKFSYQIRYKYHPKSNLNIFSEINLFKDVNIEQSKVSVMNEAFNSDIVISTSKSGACLDCIVTGAPVIEYYTYNNGVRDNVQNEFKIDGKITGLFRHLGLVLHVDNYNDLKHLFEEFNKNPELLRKLNYKQLSAVNKITLNKNNVFQTFIKKIN